MPEGTILYRVHPDFLEAGDFNPRHGAGGRFHFLTDDSGKPIPSLYAAESPAAALAESAFHDVPIRPPATRRMAFSRLFPLQVSALGTGRRLRMVELHHPGLGRLHLEPQDLTSTDPSEYPRTRGWAQALHAALSAEGLVWMSRLYNTDRSYTFFGDRVGSADLLPEGPPLDLWHGAGLRWVFEMAEASGVTIIEP